MELFLKIVLYSNKEYAIITISANKLVLSQNLEQARQKNLQNFLKDGYSSKSWGIYTLLYKNQQNCILEQKVREKKPVLMLIFSTVNQK